MKTIEQYAQLIPHLDYQMALTLVESAYRLCYASEVKEDNTQEEQERFIASKMKAGHMTPIEHVSLTAHVICDRGISHELVRHRLAAFSQQSTRFCNFSGQRHGSHINYVFPPELLNHSLPHDLPTVNTFIGAADEPPALISGIDIWNTVAHVTEWAYMMLTQLGVAPEWARSVLPTSLATNMMMTANLREWRHIFSLRALGEAGRPHPQMKDLMSALLRQAAEAYPVFFQDQADKLEV